MSAILTSAESPPSIARTGQATAFDARVFLDTVGASRKVVAFLKKQVIFSQGDPADSVMYIQKGTVKFTVASESGKEAVVAIFGSGDFFGEGGMAGQKLRMGTATAVAPSTVLIIAKDEMVRVLHAELSLSQRFLAYMLARNIRVEADLVDQLFNSAEKRLARTLLMLADTARKINPNECCQGYLNRRSPK
jgi:CRP/FNR family cyclic AMP-dependent transcriptional regulator